MEPLKYAMNDTLEQENPVPSPASSKTQNHLEYGSNFIVNDTRKSLYNLSLWLKTKVAEATWLTGVFLHVAPGMPFHEAVQVNPRFCWRCQDDGEARGIGYLARDISDKVQNQPKREDYCK